MGTGDLLGDFGERRVAHAGIFESVFRHRDCVGAAMPFAHQPGTWLQAEAGIRGDPACGPEHLRQRLQLATGRLAESAVLKFLEPVADPPDQQVATDLWRLAAVKPPPFAAEFIGAGAVRGRQLRWPRGQSLRVGAVGSSPGCAVDRWLGVSTIDLLIQCPKSGACTATSPELKPGGGRARNRGQSVWSVSTTNASIAGEVQWNISAFGQDCRLEAGILLASINGASFQAGAFAPPSPASRWKEGFAIPRRLETALSLARECDPPCCLGFDFFLTAPAAMEGLMPVDKFPVLPGTNSTRDRSRRSLGVR